MRKDEQQQFHKEGGWRESGLLAGISYMFCSMTMVLGNKAITALADIHGMQVCSVLFQNAIAVLLLSFFAKDSLNLSRMLSVGKEVGLLAIVFVTMLVSSLISFQYVSIATVVLMKNFATMVTIIGEYCFFGRAITLSTMVGFAVMFSANMMYTKFDLQYSTVGYSWCLVNVLCTSSHALLMQRITKSTDVSKQALVMYANLYSIPILSVVMVALGEPAVMWERLPKASSAFFAVNLLVAVTGGLLGYTAMWSVQTLGAGTLSMIGMLNKVPLVILGIVVFGEKLSVQSASFCALGISAGYIFMDGKFSFTRRLSQLDTPTLRMWFSQILFAGCMVTSFMMGAMWAENICNHKKLWMNPRNQKYFLQHSQLGHFFNASRETGFLNQLRIRGSRLGSSLSPAVILLPQASASTSTTTSSAFPNSTSTMDSDRAALFKSRENS